MRQNVGRPRTARRGGVLVETALVLPILVLLTCGLIEYGHFLFIRHTLHGAARQGARVAAPPRATDAQVTSAVASVMNAAGIPSNRYTVRIEDTSGTQRSLSTLPTTVNDIRVRVQCNWGTVGARPMGLIGSSVTVDGVAVMRKERTRTSS